VVHTNAITMDETIVMLHIGYKTCKYTRYLPLKFLPLIYPPELEVKETTDTASSASFLDIYLEFDDSGQLSTKMYDNILKS
jgi:hypothetical protein